MYYVPIAVNCPSHNFARFIHIDLDNKDKIVFTKRLIAIWDELKGLDFNYKHNYDGEHEQPIKHFMQMIWMS
jgi:hypothetical protein